MAIERKLAWIFIAAVISAVGCNSSDGGGLDAKKPDVGLKSNPEVAKQLPPGLTPKQQQVREAGKGNDD